MGYLLIDCSKAFETCTLTADSFISLGLVQHASGIKLIWRVYVKIWNETQKAAEVMREIVQ
ncbi:hypothetical protein I7I53_05016 [Histoplasma capsulatum var. duboisii H88]|uniref:Uncharacterized protein n=1 Tax=Ajellomyces capsulatus (strain H88) TaxID=544711 RepID=A0A8A1LX44_AJEC8|nr:hypothetical protein I7I53_05016 [Histoplasma capsulatum var. duboisii H88]